jgi:hypothetical protein
MQPGSAALSWPLGFVFLVTWTIVAALATMPADQFHIAKNFPATAKRSP